MKWFKEKEKPKNTILGTTGHLNFWTDKPEVMIVGGSCYTGDIQVRFKDGSVKWCAPEEFTPKGE